MRALTSESNGYSRVLLLRPAALLAILAGGAAQAQPAQPRLEGALIASDGQSGDAFGVSVAAQGDLLVIGADADDDACPGIVPTCDSGAAYVFERFKGQWIEVAKLRGLDNVRGDRFGNSVSAWGGVALIGAKGDDGVATNSGSAYVFEVVNGFWTQTAKLTAFDAAGADAFGGAVAVHDGVAAVGSAFDDVGAANAGSVYVFARDGEGAWPMAQKIGAPDPHTTDLFGYSVAMGEGVLVVGAPRRDAPSASQSADYGGAYVFHTDQGTWQHAITLTAPDGMTGDQFGYSVSIEGNLIAIGAYRADAGCSGCAPGAGAVYLFRNVGGAWALEAKLAPEDGGVDDRFGWSVEVRGGRVSAGAPDHDAAGVNAGAVYIFEQSGGVWGLRSKVLRPSAAASDLFGISVGADGDEILGGVYSDDTAASGAGAVEVMAFRTCPGDLDGDGAVSGADVQIIVGQWGQKGDLPGDLNGDGMVNGGDIAFALGRWGVCP